jgi:uncharacterized protein YhjY with autotransporter beta-barrel domain
MGRRAFAVIAGLAAVPAFADLSSLTFQSPIERAAARANQAAFNQLTVSSGGQEPICPEQTRAPVGACTGVVFSTFGRVRELVHTANELTGSGPTTFSLGLDQENLGFALRWTAAEELAAQGSSATQFTTSQLNSLSSRISALRFAASGARAGSAYNLRSGEGLFAANGGAGGDDTSIASRWSAFVDGSFGYGSKDDTSDPFNPAGSTGAEDGFDFDGQEITAGVDYRLNNNIVIGVLLGYTDRAVDFDSLVSIVDGRIDSKGESAMAYGLWENDRFYVSGSIGGQWLDYDLTRRITYPSLNPLVASIDVTALSETSSTTLTGTLNAGVTFSAKGFGFEPYVKLEYQDISIDNFTERGSTGFEFNYGKQDIKSFEGGVGFKLQYVITPRFGVIVPYLRGEYRKEFDNDVRQISAVFAGLPASAVSADADFNLATDEPDDDYMLGAAGASIVLPHGWQGFIQYQQVFDLDTFDDRAITGGIRLEF